MATIVCKLYFILRCKIHFRSEFDASPPPPSDPVFFKTELLVGVCCEKLLWQIVVVSKSWLKRYELPNLYCWPILLIHTDQAFLDLLRTGGFSLFVRPSPPSSSCSQAPLCATFLFRVGRVRTNEESK